MNIVSRLFKTSVGKKYLMAITGQCFCAFLVLHLAGNLTLFAGKDIFNTYASKLEGLGILVYVAEAVLIALALVHIIAALKLTFTNKNARPIDYTLNNSGGSFRKYFAAGTMIFSGVAILVFLIFHLLHFKFPERGTDGLYGLVQITFNNPYWVAFYVGFVAILATHLSHGFQSAFQSLGINHPRFTPFIKKLGCLYAVTMWAGYTVLPLYMHFAKGGNL
jgi:succinate dehydrogenase / fumarate reductase, cytochrome b subunit